MYWLDYVAEVLPVFLSCPTLVRKDASAETAEWPALALH